MMATKIARIHEELNGIHYGEAWHGPALHEILAGITARQAAARPLAGAHNIWDIVRHITVWENVFRRRLEGDPVNEPEAGDFPEAADPSPAAWADAVAELDGEHDRLLKVVSDLDDADLKRQVVGKEYSMGYLIRSLVLHHVYHAGQISLLKKAGGANQG